MFECVKPIELAFENQSGYYNPIQGTQSKIPSSIWKICSHPPLCECSLTYHCLKLSRKPYLLIVEAVQNNLDQLILPFSSNRSLLTVLRQQKRHFSSLSALCPLLAHRISFKVFLQLPTNECFSILQRDQL
jgi:hypothetical protein